MLSNNNQRLNIWLSIFNKFSYKEFANACISQSIDPLSISEFSQKVGMLMVAMTEYPDLQTHEAYLKLIERMNVGHQTTSQSSVNNGGCLGCGKDKQISDGGKLV